MKHQVKEIGIRPLADKIIIKALPVEEKTAGGIYIPATAREKPQRGVVYAVGPGSDKELTVAVGDEIVYSKNAGTEVTFEGEDYLIMRESDVFAIV
jgi:chaperonin GroES